MGARGARAGVAMSNERTAEFRTAMERADWIGDIASRWRRLAAASLDIVILWVWVGFIVGVFGPDSPVSAIGVAIYWTVSNIAGASPGKRGLHIEIVRVTDRRHPGVVRGLLRSVAVLVGLVLALSLHSYAAAVVLALADLAGIAPLLWDRYNRTLFDRLAGTFVQRVAAKPTTSIVY